MASVPLAADRLSVDDLDARIPAACTAADLARIFGVSDKTIHRRAQAGEFEMFAFRPAPIGPAKYSGDRIRRYLRGEDLRAAARPKLKSA